MESYDALLIRIKDLEVELRESRQQQSMFERGVVEKLAGVKESLRDRMEDVERRVMGSLDQKATAIDEKVDALSKRDARYAAITGMAGAVALIVLNVLLKLLADEIGINIGGG